MDIQQTKRRLQDSLELKVLKQDLTIAVIAATALALFFGFGILTGRNHNYIWERFWLLTAIMYGVMVLPVLIFTVIRRVRIFAKPESYIFCKGVLASPHGGPLRNTVFYTVVLEDPEDGGKFFVDTHAIFATHGIMPPTIEEYTNATVTIAYNRETEMVVVIG